MRNKNGANDSSWVVRIFTVILIGVIGSIVWTLYQIGEYNSQDQSAMQGLSDVRAEALTIVVSARDSIGGDARSFEDLQFSSLTFRKQWEELEPKLLNIGLPEAKVANLGQTIASIYGNTVTLLDGEEKLLFLHEVANELNDRIPNLQEEYANVVEILLEVDASGAEIAQAQTQSLRAERIGRNVEKMLVGTADANEAADQFNYDASLFGQILAGQLNGAPAMGIAKVEDPDARESLKVIADLFDIVSRSVDEVFSSTSTLLKTRASSSEILTEFPTLQTRLDVLSMGIESLPDSRLYGTQILTLQGTLALLLMVFIALIVNRNSNRRRTLAEAQNQENQESILQLLDEIADLADGDLTSEATVTEHVTGTIADAINYTVHQLRELVSQINNTSIQVSTAAQTTQQTALDLAEASDHQAQEIAGASAAVNEMAVTIDQVSANAAESAGVAARSVTIAANGAEVVQNTIEGMDTIREQIQESSKRIKRLGESSQEIGDIVSLINDIADQTNILALNAAIQASMAGEAGRGFAVVADEVQRLAERSANATKQIEILVKTIQTDTNEAVVSMEQTTAEVVRGATQAEKAGVALEEIENVSSNLAELIQNISNAARQQAASAGHISTTMNVIQDITLQTSQGTNIAAGQIGELAQMATEMQHSVEGFKLPNAEGEEIELNATSEHEPFAFDEEFEGSRS